MRCFTRPLAVVILCIVGQSAVAKDYGTYGAVFPIAEESLIDVIFERLAAMEASGEMAAMESDMKDTVRKRVARPRPVIGLIEAEAYRMFEVDLSITLDHDLMDHNGVVFAKAGTVVNPLDHSRFGKRLIFIDGDDADQVEFALDVAGSEPVKIILTNGAPFELTELHKTLFYFDQGGTLVDRLHITALPSVVSRGYPHMIVEEIPLGTQENDG